jgi:hypothetical protein
MEKKNIFRKSSTNVFYQGYKVRGKIIPISFQVRNLMRYLAKGLIISAISRGKQCTEIFVPVLKLQACVLCMMRGNCLKNTLWICLSHEQSMKAYFSLTAP